MNVSSNELKPWVKAYPPGAAETIDSSRYQNILDLLAQTTGHRKDRVAFLLGDASLTFGELSVQARALAAWLSKVAGIRLGDRVAVMLPNVLEFPVCLLGILGAGGVQVSINPMYTARELQHQLRDSGARVLITLHSAVPLAESALAGTAVERIVQVGGVLGSGTTQIPRLLFDETVAQGRQISDWQELQMTRDDLAFLQYTGGTTGISKGAELTHRNIVSNVLQLGAMWTGAVHDGEETIVTALPLFHIFALTVNCLTFMSFGARNVLVANPRDAAQLVSAFANQEITVVTGVNTLFASLLALPELEKTDYRKVKLAIGGGAAVQRAVSDAWHARSGRHIVEGYGLSETSPGLTMNSWANPQFTGSIGLPVPSTDLIIADPSGATVALGVEGEICARGPQVMRRYWRQPEATAAAFTQEGYFRTGDIGVIDERGFLRIRDRKKDMVLVSGFNVYPNEVEDVIAAIPGVSECAVTGVPDLKTGEAVKAFLVRKDPNLNESEVIARCKEQLAAYKVPKIVAFVDSLPKSAVGKILRRQLRNAE
jgi:long-chain acyl-CoA synthetase